MELRQLTYFIAVAEEAQFTRAALRCSVAQPAVSAQIRRLEHELEETLFHRDQHLVTLTAAGEALLPHARAALAAIELGRASIASLSGLQHGRLRIGVSRPTDPRLATALGTFHREHPAIDIVLTEQHNAPLLHALTGGELDAALVGLHRQPLPAQLHTLVIAAEPLVLAVRHDHPLSSRKSVTLDQLRNQPMITLTHGSGLRTVFTDACQNAGFTPRITAETSELGSLIELASEGLGVAVLPRSASLHTGLASVEIHRPRLLRRTALAWNPTNPTPAGRAFLTVAHKSFTAAPSGTSTLRPPSMTDLPGPR